MCAFLLMFFVRGKKGTCVIGKGNIFDSPNEGKNATIYDFYCLLIMLHFWKKKIIPCSVLIFLQLFVSWLVAALHNRTV